MRPSRPFPEATIREAKAKVAAIAVKRQTVENLASLVDAARNIAHHDSLRRLDATAFLFQPDRLAGAIDFFRRTDATTQALIQQRYHQILTDMLEGPAPGIKPLKVDFANLNPAARPYLAAPFLNLIVGSYPYLDFVRSDPAQGVLVYVHSGGPADPETWRPRLGKLSAWLGGNWQLTAADATSITLTRRGVLPTVIAMQPSYLRRDALFVGIDTECHQPVYVRFADLTSGTLIVGGAGSGKSNATHVLMQSILANLHLFAAVFCIDGKEGMTFARYRATAPDKLRILVEDAEVWKLAGDLVAVNRARNAALAAAGLDKAPDQFIAVIVEEMSNYTGKPVTDDKAVLKAHTQFIADLATLARRGRSAGLKLIITAQTPDNDQVPTPVRANCQTALIFNLPVDVHATMMVGQIQPGRDPRKLARGQAILKEDNGATRLVQFPAIRAPGEPR